MKTHTIRPRGLGLAIAMMLGLALMPTSRAAVYLIDFNTFNAGTYPAGYPSSQWNIYALPTNVTGLLKDTAGSTGAGVSIGYTGDLLHSTGWENFYQTAPAWTNGAGPAGDFFWTGNALGTAASFTVNFGGFSAGTIVSLDIFASRSSSLAVKGYYEYSVDGGTTWSGFTVVNTAGAAVTTGGWSANTTQSQLFDLNGDGYANGSSLSVSSVVLSSNSLLVRVTKPDTSNYVGINSMQLTVIPEPGTVTTIAAVAAFVLRIGGRRGARRAQLAGSVRVA